MWAHLSQGAPGADRERRTSPHDGGGCSGPARYVPREPGATEDRQPLDDPGVPAVFALFSEHSRRVLVLAGVQAMRFHQKHIAPEHVLYGIVAEGGGDAAEALVGLGVGAEEALVEALKATPPRKGHAAGYPPLSTQVRAAFEHAAAEVRRSRAESLEPEHVLLALLRKKRGAAASMLHGLGVSPDAVRERVRELTARAAETPGGPPRDRMDYYDAPGAPAADGIVPTVHVFVVNERDEVLMIHRAGDEVRTVPGGALHLGESVAEAAVRETLEKTGVTCEITGMLGVYSDPGHITYDRSRGQAWQEFSLAFAARPLPGEPAPGDDADDVVWVPRHELADQRMDRSMRLRAGHFLAGGPSHIG